MKHYQVKAMSMNYKKIIKAGLVGICFGALLIGAQTAFAITNDEANYWNFDDAGGRSISDTKGGQNGVMVGSSTGMGWASGKKGTALGMDGAVGTGIALPNGFLLGSQGSISVWFRMNELSDGNVIFSGKSTSDNNIFVLLSVDYEGRPQILFRTDPTSANRKAQGGAILNKNEWYHLVLVATGQTYRMYVNGEEKVITGENIGRWFPDLTNQTLSYRIGVSEANPLPGSWNGMIDELRIYSRALTGYEVTALYDEGNAGVPDVPLSVRPKPVVPVTDVLLSTPKEMSTTTEAVGNVQSVMRATFTRNLTMGARGTDVTALQVFLIKQGMLGEGLSTGYFGALTKVALVKWQAKNGLPATGYFGPMTRTKLGAM